MHFDVSCQGNLITRIARVTELSKLEAGVAGPWTNVDVGRFNGNTVCFRVMENSAADWHVHPDSDEPFLVLTGGILLETGVDTTTAHRINSGQLIVVPRGSRHRARVEGRATPVVMDSFTT
jgi:mannose-6-phosphate isomerase-like protein (cupin superfamily)